MILQLIVTLIITHIKHTTMKETVGESLMEDFLTMMREEPIVKLKIEEMTLEEMRDIITTIVNNTGTITIEIEKTIEIMDIGETMLV